MISKWKGIRGSGGQPMRSRGTTSALSKAVRSPTAARAV